MIRYGLDREGSGNRSMPLTPMTKTAKLNKGKLPVITIAIEYCFNQFVVCLHQFCVPIIRRESFPICIAVVCTTSFFRQPLWNIHMLLFFRLIHDDS